MSHGIIHVVDDDKEVRMSMDLLLTSRGYSCHTYDSGKSFLSKVLSLEAGYVFLDFRMGGLSGLEVLSEIRWLELDWPVVLMTGHGDGRVDIQALGLGAIAFMEKPFTEDVLNRVLRSARTAWKDGRGKDGRGAEIRVVHANGPDLDGEQLLLE